MDYSVAIPVYNSEGTLEELFQRLKNFFEKMPGKPDYELIFVDDYSRDDSWKTLKKLKQENTDLVKIIRLSKNYGQHNAVLCALRQTSGKRIITIDDDLQQAPEDIGLLIDRMDTTQVDLVYGIGGAKHSAIRRIGSELYKQNSKYIDGRSGKGSSFRLIEASLLRKITEHKQHFVFVEELLFWYTGSIEFVPVSHSRRKSGKSGHTPIKVFRQIINISINYSDWPLKFMVYGGALFSLVSFLFGVYFIVKRIVFDTVVPGFTALIVAIFFSSSLLLLCFGIVGKYLNNIYNVLNDKPTYSIKEAFL